MQSYSREDAKTYLQFLVNKNNRSGTIRRRINSLSAVFNFAYAELDFDKRNPMSRLMIRGEGLDVAKRGTFSLSQLKEGYEEALVSRSPVRALMPILGETGCRLAEIVGLRTSDIDLQPDQPVPTQAKIEACPGQQHRNAVAGSLPAHCSMPDQAASLADPKA